MAEAKDLNYYLANPDEMPDNLNDVLLAEPEKAEANTEDVKKEEGESSDTTEAKQEEVKAEEAQKQEEPPRLLSKNGKAEIPYQVLVSERERRAAAEKSVADLMQRLKDIEARVEAPEQKAEETKPDVTDETLQQISEDFPTIGKAIAALQAEVVSAKEKLKAVEEIEAQREATAETAARNTVQEAIDANPALRYWQAESQEMFERAVEMDNVLKADPRNRDLTLGQRFAKVVAAMEAVYGQTELPAGYKQDDAPRQDMNELTEKAKAVVKDAGTYKPKSLSDIPGGSPPVSEDAKLEGMTPAQIAAMMQTMDNDQINAMLAKLG